MPKFTYWADSYLEKRRSAREAIDLIQPGQRVFIGSSCGEPQALVRELANASERCAGLEVVRLMALESTPLTLIANKTEGQNLSIRSFYAGSGKPKSIARNKRFITPLHLSAIPRLFRSRRLHVHVALIQVSPPDDFGWMSLGVSVDITLAAAQSADLVIAQVNPKMPRVLGRSVVHVNDVEIIVEREEPLITARATPESESANKIAGHIQRFIEDGSTLQISLGTSPQAVLLALSEANDLGIHTQYITDDIMHLVSRGVITNREKGFNPGKLIASSAIGSEELYDFLDDNPGIEFHPSDYVNDPGIISRHNKMVSINVAMEVDLTGQAAADALPINLYTGVSGMLDFIRGASQAEGGKAILLLTATSKDGKRSHIVPSLGDTAVVIPRSDVQYLVTEFGAVNLFGKSLQERAQAMGLLGTERRLKEAMLGVYPASMEETVVVDGDSVMIRPAKPVDERRIQEHFYSLGKKDVIARFFHEKTRFVRDEAEGLSQIDYRKNLTLVALVGEFGFGRVIGVGEYLLDETTNIAEVAFSVSSDFQGKGIGTRLMIKLAGAARGNGIAGLLAYTAETNDGMIRLFNTLPYVVRTDTENDILELTCRFDEIDDRKDMPDGQT
ncbi:Acetyl-CoA hydrolase [Olavius algarvensis associated proteobacterium Delta 3]|nr:Acetyl-CoA hydrolase [Olavius algarvensis associated proteobacterium Delta 3]